MEESGSMINQMHYDLHARICKTLSHPKRLELVDLLREGEKSVKELMEALTVSQGTLSRCISVMRSIGMVVQRREAQKLYYQIRNPKIFGAFDIMGEVVLEHLEARARMAKAPGDGLPL
jgi:ArsR family transcriptional regulator